jgi:hypothetical protein
VCDKEDIKVSNVYIPKMFAVEYVENDDAKLYVQNNKICLSIDNDQYEYEWNSNFRYPDYVRIIPKDTKSIPYDKFIKNSKTLDMGICRHIIRAFKIDDKIYTINNDFVLDYKFDSAECREVEYRKINTPIAFKTEHLTYVVMPLIFEDYEYKEVEKAYKYKENKDD